MSIFEGASAESILYRYKAKVSDDDTSPDYLESLIQSGDNAIEVEVINEGGDEKLSISLDETALSAIEDERVKVTGSSPSNKYLNDALHAGSGIVISYDSGDDQLDIAFNGALADATDTDGTPSDGNVFVFNDGVWVPQPLELNDLDDVDVDTPELYDVLVRNSDGTFDNRFNLLTAYSSLMWGASDRKKVVGEYALAEILRQNYVEDIDGSSVMARTQNFDMGRCSVFVWSGNTLDTNTIAIDGLGTAPTPSMTGSNKEYDASNTLPSGQTGNTTNGILMYIDVANTNANMVMFSSLIDKDYSGNEDVILDFLLYKDTHTAGDTTYIAIQFYFIDLDSGNTSSVHDKSVTFTYDGSTDMEKLSVALDADVYNITTNTIIRVGVSIIETEVTDEVLSLNFIAGRVSYPTKKYNLDIGDI